MNENLQYQTINFLIKSVLRWIMDEEVFNPFRLVGGTALSLKLGHRQSVDIDLFTDAEYGSIDFHEIDSCLKEAYKYVDSMDAPIAFGKSYFVGNSSQQSIKLDLFYTDAFIRPLTISDGIRFASIEDIVAMKIDVIGREPRKKDFWDIHELLEKYPMTEMLLFHQERYPYSHNRKEILKSFTNFEDADNDFDPVCLKGKHWELIKLDIFEAVKNLD